MNQLFRPEAVDRRSDRLLGDVVLAVPVSWRIVTAFLAGSLILGLAALTVMTFSQVETVRGSLVPDSGYASVVASRPGVVAAIHVHDGERVRAGQRLATILAEERAADGSSAQVDVIHALERQSAENRTQAAQFLAAARVRISQIEGDIRGLEEEVALLQRQRSLQHQLVEAAETDLQSLEGLGQRGFISRRDLNARRDLLLARRQQLAQLDQALAEKSTSLGRARRQGAQETAIERGEAARLRAAASEIDQRLATARAGRGYALIAPVSGIVTGLDAHAGEHTLAERAIMAIIPDNYRLEAQFEVPTSAAGFLAVGQQVLVSVDALPAHRFGTLNGQIASISSIARHREPSEEQGSTYKVIVELAQPSVRSLPGRGAIRPGMTVEGQIVVQRQPLMSWLISQLVPDPA